MSVESMNKKTPFNLNNFISKSGNLEEGVNSGGSRCGVRKINPGFLSVRAVSAQVFKSSQRFNAGYDA